MNHSNVFELQSYIRTTPETLWNALTDGQISPQYYTLNSRVESTWEVGAHYQYVGPGEQTLLHGTVETVEPTRRLVMTFNADFLPAEMRGAESTVSFEMEPVGENTKLTLSHAGLMRTARPHPSSPGGGRR